MKKKYGKCVDCSPSDPLKPLTKGRCEFHYWRHRAQVKKESVKGKAQAKAKAISKQGLTQWYNTQLSMVPARCENCGVPLRESMIINPRTVICHIVPKSLYPEVKTHPLNRWFGCHKCHNIYDNGSPEDRSGMSVYRAVVSRSNFFINTLVETQKSKAQGYLNISE